MSRLFSNRCCRLDTIVLVLVSCQIGAVHLSIFQLFAVASSLIDAAPRPWDRSPLLSSSSSSSQPEVTSSVHEHSSSNAVRFSYRRKRRRRRHRHQYWLLAGLEYLLWVNMSGSQLLRLSTTSGPFCMKTGNNSHTDCSTIAVVTI